VINPFKCDCGGNFVNKVKPSWKEMGWDKADMKELTLLEYKYNTYTCSCGQRMCISTDFSLFEDCVHPELRVMRGG
jgi:hypothetical protein